MSKIITGEKKYVIIPEAYPLFAMSKVFGPKTGPLARPTPVPINIIGELLQQTGKHRVTIYEVIPTERDKKTGQPLRFSDPVQLNLGNYTLPYEEIKNGKTESSPVEVVVESVPEQVEIKPEVVEVEPQEAETAPAPVVEEPVVDQTPTDVEADVVVSEVPAEPVVDTPVEESEPEEPVERVEEIVETQNTTDPWEGMTDSERAEYNAMSKAEKKAARRAHREAMNASAE